MVTVTTATVHRVLANRPDHPMLQVYAGPDRAAAEAAYAAEEHAYMATQVGTFDADLAPVDAATVASAHK